MITSRHTRPPRGSARRLVVVIAISALFVLAGGGAGWLLAGQRGADVDRRTTERNAAVGAAEQVIDCVNDPAVTATSECEAEAQDAQQTLEQDVPPVALTGRQRREVVLIAASLIAEQPSLSEDDIFNAVVDEVLDQLPDVDDGDTGPRGRPGADGETPSTAEIRALVEAVYAANPPAPGQDGTNGTNGTAGARGLTCVEELGIDRCRGPKGDPGDLGPQGVAGPQGEPGQPGRDGLEGPAGPQGPAGPACPAGYEGRELQVLTPGDGPLTQPGVVTVFACVPAPATSTP